MSRRSVRGVCGRLSGWPLRLACLAGMLAGLSASGDALAQIPNSERVVLINLFNATLGPGWTDHTNWCADASCTTFSDAGSECTWFGVTCDAGLTHVVAIELSDNGLASGDTEQTYLPLPDLTDLTALETFDIGFDGVLAQRNAVISVLPPLPASLQTFRAGSNQLRDPIPASSSLVTFDVPENSFANTPDLSGWPNLVYFDVSRNNIDTLGMTAQGTLCGANSNLKTFLAASMVNGQLNATLPALSDCAKLQTFVVSGNALSGAIPALAGLHELQTFDVSVNQLTGSLPDLSDTPALVTLNAYGNQLDGAIPSLGACPQLRTFDVASNLLSGAIPALTGLIQLQTLDVSANALTGAIPDLSAAPALATFAAAFNQLSGSLPSLSTLSGLLVFDVSDNQLTGSIGALSGSPSLLAFRVADNQLSASLPALSSLSELLVFDAADNQFSGSVPDIAGLSKLALLYLDHNQLSGDFPDLTGVTSLLQLDVSHNQIGGSLPDLGALTGLTVFHVEHNQLSGGLPANFETLQNLFDFAVGHNQLSGGLPDISALTAMHWFDIGANSLTGPLPPRPPGLNAYFSQVHLCPNPLTIGGPNDAQWDGADEVSPWYAKPYPSNLCDDFFTTSFEQFGL